MTLDEQIAFCEEKSKNIKLKAEPQVFIDIKECLEELKEIRGCISEIGKFIGKEKTESYKQGYCEGSKAANKRQQWISVEDRLLENDATVLCLMGNRYVTHEPFYTFGFCCGGAWKIASNQVLIKLGNVLDILYWMPLPDTPEIERK